ncbi:adhesin, partial [Flavobacterium sp. TH16-21]|nr:adhesin [Flavobacterium lacisediminis]
PVTGFTYPTPVCSNGANITPTTVVGFTTGGTYSSTPGLSINGSTGEINVAGSTPGNYTITYLYPATTCGPVGSSTFNITITALPVATISYAGSPYCATGLATVTQTGNTGGVYSSTPGLVINAGTGEVDLAASTSGTYTVSYTIAAAAGCPAVVATASITINPIVTPVTGFSYSTPVCSNGSNITPTTVVGFTTGGTYSSTPGLSINGSTGEINVAGSTP